MCRQRAALVAPRVASFAQRLLDAALTSPHSHAAALLCAASRLLVACPRIAAILHGGSGGSGPSFLGLLNQSLPVPEEFCGCGAVGGKGREEVGR